MILFIGGPVDWEGGPIDWRAWETWMGDIGYRGRGCVSLESERKEKGNEMSRLNTDRQTDRHVNIELEFCEMLTEFATKQNLAKECPLHVKH